MKVMDKKLYVLLFFCLLVVCCKKHTVDFSYSPAEPKAGETVSFTNLSSDGEKWAWTFGDGATSTSRTPTKVYRRPGQYTITLMMDSSKHRIASKEIIIYDTIPTFSSSSDSIYSHKAVTFSAVAYNPFNRSVTYNWKIPSSASLIEGSTLDGSSLTAFFNQGNVEETVSLTISVGSVVTEINNKYYIYSTPTQSILYFDGNDIYSQKIYEYGTEEPKVISYLHQYVSSVVDLFVYENECYLLSPNALYVWDMENNEVELVSKKSEEGSKMSACFLNKGSIYMSDEAGAIYSVDSSDREVVIDKDDIFVDKNKISDFPTSKITGMGICGNIWFVASANGVYRFSDTEIDSGTESSIQSILSEYSIDKMQVDPIAKKIYFLSSDNLYIANLDGEYCKEIAEGVEVVTMWLDQSGGYVYYCTIDGVYRLPLIQTYNNRSVILATQVSEQTGIVLLTSDNIKR